MMIPFNAAQHSLLNPIVMPFNGGRRSESNQMMMSHHFDESMIHNFSNMRVGRNAFPGNYQVINEVPPEDRTMFVTFSRGYPVAEREVRHFFSTNFGDCIESFHMQEVRPHEQPLYARVVFLKPVVYSGNSRWYREGQVYHQRETCLDAQVCSKK
ncbi:Uncharacterized protein Adt_07700 [Abeliophyllum distichum]|uniref:Uncharacterized protein n=1 Tax=Abeliophyllum distichum TaxID=126358 RepID=A0ABD1VAJ8_9LAMI